MRMARRKHKDKEEHSKIPDESLGASTFEDYRCSGNIAVDFPALCIRLGIKNVPVVKVKPLASGTSETTDPQNKQKELKYVNSFFESCLEVVLGNEDPLSVKRINISGWTVTEQIIQVLLKMLPCLSQLLIIQFCKAGLTDPMVISLTSAISLSSCIRAVVLDGNPLPEQNYHLLLSEDSPLTHLSLRNNRIGSEGARLIGTALSTVTSANKNLVYLNMAFNSIGDEGASHIARGLRLNRTLCFLSLSSNVIGDDGAAHLAEVLGELSLNHEEVVERRKLLLQRLQSVDSTQSSAVNLSSNTSVNVRKSSGKKKEVSKKEDKQAAGKDSQKSSKNIPDSKRPPSKGLKSKGKEQEATAVEPVEVEAVNLLLDHSIYRKDGQLFLPRNTTFTSLNLAGNNITKKSLPLFLALLEVKGEGKANLQFSLQRNLFPPECECYLKITELMAPTDEASTTEQNPSEQNEEEGQEAQP